jgi:hypothetical protein
VDGAAESAPAAAAAQQSATIRSTIVVSQPEKFEGSYLYYDYI